MQQINNLREAVAAADARPVAIQQADIDVLMREVARLRLQNAALEEGQRAIAARQAAEMEQMLAAQAETNRRAQEVAQRNAILEQENNRAAEAELARQRALLPPPPPRYPAPVFPAEWSTEYFLKAYYLGLLKSYVIKEDIDQFARTYQNELNSFETLKLELTEFYTETDRLLELDSRGALPHSDPNYWRVFLVMAVRKGIYFLPTGESDLTHYKTFN